MAGTISGAKSTLNIRLGQVPQIKVPVLNSELQGIYNALHILNQYMGALTASLEGAEGQDPSQSLRFRSHYWGEALQAITAGDIVCSFGTGIIKGVLTGIPNSPIVDSQEPIGSPGLRSMFGLNLVQAQVALTDAAIGEQVQVGIGPGVLAVSGAKCGNIIWAHDSRSVYTNRRANTVQQYVVGRDLVANGGLLLNNVIGGYNTNVGGTNVRINWEGYWLPGFPTLSGNTYRYNRVFLYPVGICIKDGFVLFNDYVRSDSLPQRDPPL